MNTLPRTTTWEAFTANVNNLRRDWATGALTATFRKRELQAIVNEDQAILGGVIGPIFIPPTAKITIVWAVK